MKKLEKHLKEILYLNDKLLWPLRKIAEKFECSIALMYNFIKENGGLEGRTRSKLRRKKNEEQARNRAQYQTFYNKQRRILTRIKMWDAGIPVAEMAKKLRISHVGVAMFISKYRKLNQEIFPYRNDKVWTVEQSKEYWKEK